MTAIQMLKVGRVREAQQAIGAWLRDHPSDTTQRTFLFELLCFSGSYDRAKKHLAILAKGGQSQELGAVLYFSALHAEMLRHERYQDATAPPECVQSPPGRLNGYAFQSLSDADPKIGARVEVFAAGSYLWIPFTHLSTIYMEPPRRLRDTLWAPATLTASAGFEDSEPRQVLLPAIYPYSWEAEHEALWLGRTTEWMARGSSGETPVGQKMLIVDGEEMPFLEIRSLEFDKPLESGDGVA
ncbi:MAG TPA: type VI secretion system accessory protein TagJ [Bryobacteraceae bacterium]|nr:type VI secretion system accessory protein TagJ [Bryobacteraceae bacterium]